MNHRALPVLLCVGVFVAVLLCGQGAALAGEEVGKGPMGREFYVYTPKEIDPAKTYWLVVGAHTVGGKGKGAAGMNRWVSKGNVIAVGPTFPGGFQFLGGDSDKQLIWIFKHLHKKYKLHKRMFLYGFSAGSSPTGSR